MKTKNDDIAVIGMSGRFPSANGVSEYWDNLCAGKDCVRDFSDDELRAAGVPESDIADPDYVRSSPTLDGIDRFDPGFFRISPMEAELMDPQIRLMLQCAWETLEDAGYARHSAQDIGVFAGAGGVTCSYFAHFVNLDDRFDKTTAGAAHLVNDKDFLSTYLSYKLNLTGPSMTVQTACSTSLVALHQARMSLLNGECGMALAGGVTVRVPHVQGYRYREGFIFSRSGRIRTFDAGADGVVFGSGLGLVLLKRLQDAVRDGDNIHAVIKGSAIGNDGKGKMSYAASSAKGQIACVRAALGNAGVDPASIGFVEAHGTGTGMGDPEEVKALSVAFKERTGKRGYCALGAVKANVGHADAAAGILGFIKTVLVVKHGLIPPVVHYTRPNPKIRLDETPFYINDRLAKWAAKDAPRRAAINSLGIGGTNAFVVIEQHERPKAVARKAGRDGVVVPLSAKTADSLRAFGGRLRDFLAAAAGEKRRIAIADLAHTLQVGRAPMPCRVAFCAASIDDLRRQLERWLDDGALAPAETPQGALAAAWAGGEDIDWSAQPGAPTGQRISLPTYAFAQERCWIEARPAATGAQGRLHPLLHANTSTLARHRYASRFCGEESFLRDHRVAEPSAGDAADALRRILPGAAYLEMARAAIVLASPDGGDADAVALQDIVWPAPLEVCGDTELELTLLAQRPAPGDSGADDSDIGSGAPQGDAAWIAFEAHSGEDRIHCQGRGRRIATPASMPGTALPAAAAFDRGALAGEEVYRAFARMGLAYGPAHRPISGIAFGDDQLLAELDLPASVARDAADFVLHPSVTDGLFQAAAMLVCDPKAPPAAPILPFALRSLRVHGACAGPMQAWVRYASAEAGARARQIDIDLFDVTGRACVEIRGYLPRHSHAAPSEAWLATRVWTPRMPEPTATPVDRHRVLLWALPQIEPAGIESALIESALVEPALLGGDCIAIACEAGDDLARRYAACARAAFEALKSLIAERPAHGGLLQIVVPDTDADAVCIGLSGLLKSAHRENPQVRGQLLVVDPAIDAEALAALLDAESRQARETLVRHRGNVRDVADWRVLADAADADGVGDVFKDAGVYVVTGGLGGLGLRFAHRIATVASRARIVLTGRGTAADIAASPAKRAALEALQAVCAGAEYRPLDLSDARGTADAIAAIVRDHGRIDGLLHCAGMTEDGFLLRKPVEAFERVLAPKVAGTWHLDQATQALDLDFFLLFSSLTSAVGNLGQTDYAAANGFLDEFAAHRNRLRDAGLRRGLTQAIRWPYWAQGGMRLEASALDQLHRTTGTRPMATDTAMRLFRRSLATGLDQTLALEGDPVRMRRMLDEDAGAGPQPDAAADRQAAPAAQGPIAAQDLQTFAERLLCEQLSSLLKLPPERISPTAPLEDYGIDSILTLDLTARLEKTFGPLPKTLLFEYLTLRELAGYFLKAHAAVLRARLGDRDTGAAAAPSRTPANAEAHDAAPAVVSIRAAARVATRTGVGAASRGRGLAIAIVGVSGRYPLARDLEAYWRNLRDGRDCIVEVPRSRWDWRDYYSADRSQKGRHYSRWGGFIDGIDEFDARFFNVSPAEAELLDPQERLFLEHAWMAIEDAGHPRAALQIPNGDDLPAQVGVYAGVMYNEYQLLGAEASLRGQRTGFASNPASIANRVSYALNLHGPSMVVDTMCSSSLTAIHLACQDLAQGRTALAIAGGVNVTLHPNKYLMLSAGQFISGDGHCQSFGEGGDGYIPGEGVGVVVLKRLADAERDGDRIHAVIRGSALSHGGKTNGYTVPNPQAQASAVRQALAEAEVDPRWISYIEAHGTGTRLGDPIEIAALCKVFGEDARDTGPCLIGSAKSNIGHAEAAAGIAGLTKVLLQMRHGMVVPSLHSSRLNPHIDFERTPFVVNQGLRRWDAPVLDGRPLPRIAGISSFGAGGSNAHLIVEEYVAPAVADLGEIECIVPLSARTADQLRRKAIDLLDMLRDDARRPSFPALASTLQTGREPMDERLAVLADSVAQLESRLQAWLDGQPPAGRLFAGNAKAGREAHACDWPGADNAGEATAQRDPATLAARWVDGHPVDWTALPPTTRLPAGRSPARLAPVGLPPYPFARQRHWFGGAAVAGRAMPAQTAAQTALHPLLHRNESDLAEQRYASDFTGDEPFLAGAADARRLGEAACLDMACAALRRAVPTPAGSTCVELREVAWAQPGPALGAAAVRIAVFDPTDAGVAFEIFSAGDSEDAPAILAQGRARHATLAEPAALDPKTPTAGARGDGATLIALPPVDASPVDSLPVNGLPVDSFAGETDAVLRATLRLQAALDAIPTVGGEAFAPAAMASLRVFRSAATATFVAVRASAMQPATFDLDLCDAQGRVCVEIRGLSAAPSAAATAIRTDPPVVDRDVADRDVADRDAADAIVAATSAPASPVATSRPTPVRIEFATAAASAAAPPPAVRLATPVPASTAKPSDIRLMPPSADDARRILATEVPAKPAGIRLAPLAAPVPARVPAPARSAAIRLVAAEAVAAVDVDAAASTAKPVLSLPALGARHASAAAPASTEPVALFDHGAGLYAIRIEAAADGNRLTARVIARLRQALDALIAMPSVKALMIEGGDDVFLQGDREACEAALDAGLFRTIATLPFPVVAVVAGDALGAGLLVAALADFMVCGEDARLAFAMPGDALSPTAAEPLLSARFGVADAFDLLYLHPGAPAADWKARGASCPILPREAVADFARRLADDLCDKPQTALRLLKRHLARGMAEAAEALSGFPALPAAAAGDATAVFDDATGLVRLRSAGAGVVSATLSAACATEDPDTLLRELQAALARIEAAPGPGCVLLTSEAPGFLPAVDDAAFEGLARGFAQALSATARPIVAAAPAGADALAWFALQACDALICAADGRHDAGAALRVPGLREALFAAVSARRGAEAAKRLLLAGDTLSADVLRAALGSAAVVDAAQVHAEALSKARALAAWPVPVQAAMQAARAARSLRAASTPQAADSGVAASSSSSAPVAGAAPVAPIVVELGSAVVSATLHPDGVLDVRMADRAAKNMFSAAFSQGLRAAFAFAEADPRCRVVVLSGYDTYFSSGGTRDTLLAIHDGRTTFTDDPLYRLPLDCSVPVVAAMQGHGIGAGWALGMFADLALFADEGRYLSPYMGYGFTPGAGSTLVFPRTIGEDLARETLLSAREYAGGELKARGLRQPVLPRADVPAAGLSLAAEIARTPREHLVALKRLWSVPLRAALEDACEREVEMHRQTFVGQAETLARIRSRFANEAVPEAQPATPSAVVAEGVPAAAAATVAEVSIEHLRALLAGELRMEPQDIGEDEQFVDLGLDSITGVTWIRRINEHYGTAIEAIRVYSYPTLRLLAGFVREQAAKSAKSAASAAVQVQVQIPVAVAAQTPASVAQAHAAQTADGGATLAAELRELLAGELRMEPQDIGEDEQFVDLGLDSITGVTWIRRINERYGTAIEAIKVYSHPTLRRMAAFVEAEAREAGTLVAAPQPVAPPQSPDEAITARAPEAVSAPPPVVRLRSWRRAASATAPSRAAARATAAASKIAVVGMAGQFPKSDDLEAFWRNIAEGRDCIDLVPKSRWDIDRHYQAGDVAPGKTYSRWMGALDGHDRFDAGFFNVSPREARAMDPQQRLFLQACWHGIEHAGYNPRALAGSRCGVFAGCSHGDYLQGAPQDRLSGQGFTGAAPSILSARIAYLLDLHGPSLSIDTACSSSLVAIATACDSLVSGGCDLALAGGVNVMSGPSMQIMTAQVGMLSPDGRCFAFDARANGIVNGEGVGVVMLKRLADAERDGDEIHAVIEGWGVNQDGRTNGITAPNAESQTRLQQEVYDRFGIDPAGIQLIEAHGTGTPLGDPIEVAGLKAAFAKYTRDSGYCALGSVKSNIGHCLTAAGVSGFLKAALAVERGQLPPTVHFDRLNPHIALDGSPFYVNDRLRAWRAGEAGLRRAAVSAFGFSGTNAHVVLAEYRRPHALPAPALAPVLVPLSAKTPERLVEAARGLSVFLAAAERGTLDLARIAWTLQIGREPMGERLALIVDGVDDLRRELDAFVANDPGEGASANGRRFRGRPGGRRDALSTFAADPDFGGMIAKWIARREWSRLAELWVGGLDVDWRACLGGAPAPRPVGLPGYPFARERHWIDSADQDAAHGAGQGGGQGRLHPLLHANVSNLACQRYRSAFAGEEWFLANEAQDGAKALPFSSALEMARAAVADALPELADGARIALLDAVWHAPATGTVTVTLGDAGDGRVAFEIRDDADPDAIRCDGFAEADDSAAPEVVDLDALRTALMREGEPLADVVTGRVALSDARRTDRALLARIALPAAMATQAGDYGLHPAVVEGALLAGGLLLGVSCATWAKAAGTVRTFADIGDRATVHATRDPDDGRCVDLALYDDSGRLCIALLGVSSAAQRESARVDTAPAPATSATARPVVAPSPVAAAPKPEAIPLAQVVAWLKASLAEALFMAPSDLDVERSFTDLGLDSIIGVEWMKQVNRQYGTALSATRVYDYPSVRALAAYLHGQLAAALPAATAADALVETPVAPAAPAPSPVAAAPPAEAIPLAQVVAWLKASLAEALFMAPSDLDVERSFTDLGLDSIIGVEWMKQVNRQYGTALSATRVYDYPSVRALAAYLHGQLAAASPAAGPAAVASLPAIPPADPATPAALPAPAEAEARRPIAFTRPAARFALRREAIRFAPTFPRAFSTLYFRCSEAEGDFDRDGVFTVRCAISPETNASLREHVVFGQHLLPTDAYVELLLSAFRRYFSAGEVAIENVAFVSPMIGAAGRDTHLQVVFRAAPSGLDVSVRSGPTPASADAIAHMHGRIVPAAALPAPVPERAFAVLATLDATRIPTNAGTCYAPLRRLAFGDACAEGELRTAPCEATFVADPFMLYGGLCTVINHAAWLAARDAGEAEDDAAVHDHFLPVRIGRLWARDASSSTAGAYRCRAELLRRDRDAFEFRFDVFDAGGRRVAAVDAITLSRVSHGALLQQIRAADALPASGGAPTPMPSPAARAPRTGAAGEEQIAIIGMSCRYPQSADLDAFWDTLRTGRDCVVEVPPERWGDLAAWYDADPKRADTAYSKWAGLLDDADRFDPLFFGISPAEAELIDPQQRVFMEECWKAIENAGYAPSALSGSACGVYVGCANGDYVRVLGEAGMDRRGASFMGTSSAILAARIAYVLNLNGPALAIDTACSSSLVAVHLACESIRRGENTMALAGGVNVLTTPYGHILTSQVGMPSRDGRCAAFDASANGIVFSEGCGVLVLKALSHAIRDNDEILGVIRASGSNQDGKTNGITAPSSNAQERLLRQVYGRYGIDPARIGYVEAHGTATALGDPIEVNALTAVYGESGRNGGRCLLGSVKSNIGHAGFAAGVASIVKVLLCLKHRKLVPSIHYRQPNPHIDFEASPFQVSTEYRDWDSDAPRLAAVSSFGFSGTNAHVVIEEYAGPAPAAAARGDVLVPLSAKTGEQLRQKVVELLAFIAAQDAPVALDRLAATLQFGRDAMDHRLAVVADSIASLEASLQAWLDGRGHPPAVRQGQKSRGDELLSTFAEDADMREVVARWIRRRQWDRIADLWARGYEIDWRTLHDGAPPRRMRLPTYPFARERCWAERRASAAAAPASSLAGPVLHPLLHRNTSDLDAQRYSSVFAPDAFPLADHRVGTDPVLPAVAYLEMARAALAEAVPGDAACVELRHVAWARPLVVRQPTAVNLVVYRDDDDTLGFEIESEAAAGEDDVLHCRGSAVLLDAATAERVDLDLLRARMFRAGPDAAALYASFAAMGLHYGPSFRGLTAIARGDGELLVDLHLPDVAARAGFVLDPGMLDSALQGAIAIADEDVLSSGARALPFAVEAVRIFSACAPRMVAWIRLAADARARGPGAGLAKVDIDLFDSDGRPCVQMRGFSSRATGDDASFDERHYASIIAGLLERRMSVDEAMELG
ncbi:MAG: SDR family NAD(P)-dependent oxidoreductase [Xanthomonadales bacterium]|nr:SDR family NAD(P)-dependent oxidoreductase [Xanthomonadales bacterium]